MSTPASISIPAMNLLGNPIIANLFPGENRSRRYRIYHLVDAVYEMLFEGSVYTVYSPVPVDISDVFKSLSFDVLSCKIALVGTDGIDFLDFEFLVYQGAVNKLLQRKLKQNNTDIFEWKLKNKNANFLLTTRTNSRLIVVPENELQPLYYYCKDFHFSIKDTSGTTLQTKDHSAVTADSLQNIDLAALRKSVYLSTGKLNSLFDIVNSDEGYCCTIVIAQAAPSNYFLKFRNSFNVFETLAILGDLAYQPVFDEQRKHASYDDAVKSLSNRSSRALIEHVYSTVIGHPDNDKRLFLLDALHSAECYLIAGSSEYRVTITADIDILTDTTGQPNDIALKITLVDKDDAFSPISGLTDSLLATNESELVNTDNNNKILIQ